MATAVSRTFRHHPFSFAVGMAINLAGALVLIGYL